MRRSFRLMLAAAISVPLVLLSAPAVGDTRRIKAEGGPGSWRWDPTKRTIATGDKIVWKNPTGVQHVVHAYSNNWNYNKELEPNGGSARKTFKSAGLYKFRCTTGDGTATAHSHLENGKCSGMCGKIRVN